jgi:alpha-tubulin suppressor-like RCC1 family protein
LSIGPDNCVVMGDGTVRCTTAAGPDLVDQGLSGVQKLASGAIHHCALRSDGTVWCWGDNEWGALGDPSLPAATVRTVPAQVPGITNVVRIDTRDSYNQQDITCVLDRGGEVTCWGGDWSRAPTRVAALAGSREIAVADFSVCGVADAATVRCVYPDGGVTTYLLNERIVGLTAAFYMLCAQSESLDVFCMGAGGKPAPSLEPELEGARFLATGLGQVCGLLPDGTIGCTVGSEGSTFADRCEGTDVVDLDATQRFLCALHADGTIRCGSSG